MKTDTLFYRIFQTCPELLFEHLGLDLALAEKYTFSSREVKQLTFRLDDLFLPTQADIPLYFVEVQFQWDAQFYYRFLAEIYLYLRQYRPGPAWYAVVIYPHGSLDSGIPADLAGSEAQIIRIYLDELPLEGSLLMSLLRLIIAPAKQAEQRAYALVAQSQGSGRDILELVKTALVYKFIHKSRQEIEAMFGLSELTQTRVYQEGQQEGRQEGRQEGQQLGEATVVLRILRRKFNTLPPEIEQRISALSVKHLVALAESLLEFGSLDELQTWLGQLGA